jgi:hypothetical protein
MGRTALHVYSLRGYIRPTERCREGPLVPDQRRKVGEEMNSKLEEANKARLRHDKIDWVFRRVLDAACITLEQGDLVELLKRLPDIDESHVQYVSTAPGPDYISGFGDILSLYMGSVWDKAKK